MSMFGRESRRGGHQSFCNTKAIAAATAVILVLCCSCAARRVKVSPARDVTPVIRGEEGFVYEADARAIIRQLASKAPDPEAFSRLLSTIAALSHSPMFKGNRAELLIDGPITYQAMLGSIERAKCFIYLETFTFSDDKVGQQFADALLEKVNEGVDIYVIYDSLGSADSNSDFFAAMKDAGIHLLAFHKVNPLNGGNLFHLDQRDHRKLMVVDGKVAITGGVNISHTFSNSSPQGPMRKRVDDGWRDTDIQISGPAVQGFQDAFQNHWRSEGGADDEFPGQQVKASAAGDELVAILQTRGDDGQGSSIYTAYMEAIEAAREKVWITQAYFSPDREFLDQLADAAERGVDVRVLLPGMTDSSLVRYASESHYGRLLRAGVKIYKRKSSVLHAKTAVIDGIWSTVGSSNLDYRSFVHNDEINAVIFGTDFARQMEGQFKADIMDSKPLTLEQWKKRPLRNRLKEIFSRIFQYWI